MNSVPDRPQLAGLEEKWDEIWGEREVYRFDRSKPRSEVFSIDTPPPTVSGQLHLGTAFGYIQVDAMARFQRMRGREVFYPMGWDDNGLPTERRVQNHFGVRCDPTVAYEPDLVVPDPSQKERPVSRRNFLELCEQLTEEDEQTFEAVFRHCGLSVDWSLKYATIDHRSRLVAQREFLRNLARGQAYHAEAPTLWDVDFQTAVAQAELDDRNVAGSYHRISFSGVEIETTRPELLAACVALVAHPDDERYQPLFGTTVTSPVFGVEVPVVAHHLAQPDKGTGIAMVCTFGDTTDVVWWRELGLPMRVIIGRDGRVLPEAPWLEGKGADAYDTIKELHLKKARKQVVALLEQEGSLIGEPRQIQHDVKFYEKGDRPLEIVASRQWYVRNGAQSAELSERLIELGRELQWHPPFMRIRFEHWVEGLNSDWLISRQRYFGVPFPVWYPLDASGEVIWDSPILPSDDALPVDPQATAPEGFDEAQRGQPNGFVGDPDVMDTWATSSLTPQIVCGWATDDDLFERTFPMDLRPQGPEIIRTWLFSTLLRSELEHGGRPWDHVSINGWILDPDRKKMSKSVGNVLTPAEFIDEHGADALRYWSCSAAPGVDTAVDVPRMKVGRRLAIKLLNVTKLTLGLPDAPPTTDLAPLDRALLAKLADVVESATRSFESYEYQAALDRIDEFFWNFCDDYVELVKERAYGEGADGAAARHTLRTTLGIVLRLYAPFVPFASEEAWSWFHDGSVHRESWPTADELAPLLADADPLVLTVTTDVLRQVRRAKSEAKRSMRSEVALLTITDTAEHLAALAQAWPDLRAAGSVTELVTVELASGDTAAAEASEASVVAELAPDPTADTPPA
ncbi:MAG: valine--tRNA ligase [Acidimicrobiales bacterium]